MWLFAHRVGCAVTARGCLPTKWVVRSQHEAVHSAATKRSCSPTKRVVHSLHMAVRPLNRWCGHCTGLFAHPTGGAVTAHGCLSNERWYGHQTSSAVTVHGCFPIEWGYFPTELVVWSPNWWCDHRTWLFAHHKQVVQLFG